ncbi:SHOCT domain-containing protein [Aliamphritea ceti]|uniref:SHOCT domain-containing protein n=1 Tax=Aliamphritea ceti TaxID=1524258 RepID=UPI0021C3391F|nr:SHOCT domain-containing protein [Aliamphritea ceti]
MAKEPKHVTKYKERHLSDGESVIAWGEGYIGEALGKGDKAQQNGALVVTETLVAFYRKGFLGEILETMPLKNITSIERKSTMGHRTIRLHTSHDDLAFKTFQKDNEEAIVQAIEDGRSKAGASVKAESDGLDKLKKLAELRDAGVLSEAEFIDKKEKILEEI